MEKKFFCINVSKNTKEKLSSGFGVTKIKTDMTPPELVFQTAGAINTPPPYKDRVKKKIKTTFLDISWLFKVFWGEIPGLLNFFLVRPKFFLDNDVNSFSLNRFLFIKLKTLLHTLMNPPNSQHNHFNICTMNVFCREILKCLFVRFVRRI